MTFAAEVKLFAQPFLARNEDFVFQRRELIRLPIRHVMTGFVMDRTSSVTNIRPHWFAGIQFGPPPWFDGGIGNFIDGAAGGVDDTSYPARFLAELERTTTDTLDKVGSIQGILDYPWVPIFGSGIRPQTKAILLAALGRFAEAEVLLAEAVSLDRTMIDGRRRQMPEFFRTGSKRWQRLTAECDQLEERLKHLEELLEPLRLREPAAIGEVLHRWEGLSTKARKVERWWQPSPFPFERK